MNSLESEVLSLVSENVEWLAEYQIETGPDSGGIEDHILGRVVGDNYATEEFALALAVLRSRGLLPDYDEHFERAMNFHARTSAGYPRGTHAEHYQHRRLGFIEALLKAKQFGSRTQLSKWRDVVHRWDTRDNPSNCNWHAMNVLLDRLVYNVTGSGRFRRHAFREFIQMLGYWQFDGLFTDSFDAYDFEHVDPPYVPLAYHMYTAALLHRYYYYTDNSLVRRIFLRSVRVLLPYLPKNGHPTYRGRSAGHIFTYGVSFYVLLAAAIETEDTSYLTVARPIIEQITDFQRPDGRLPVVANRKAYDERIECQAQYAYHSVYNAHCSAWLARSLSLLKSTDWTAKGESKQARAFFRERGGLFSVDQERYSAVVSNGRGGNYDAALSLAMLDVSGELCSLPPGPSGSIESSGHVLWIHQNDTRLWDSVRTTGTIDQYSGNRLVGSKQISTRAGNFDWNRRFTFDCTEITLHDEVAASTAETEDITVQMTYSLPETCSICSVEGVSLSTERVDTVLGSGTTYRVESTLGATGRCELEIRIVFRTDDNTTNDEDRSRR
ncbi:hypothetical protein HISP_10830 [Haloarcula hispanica N601]|uniref:Heparin-sulfate lyase N-terminal domain-containing protein n=2 Tax=Haloarcula hispanica TaxID=51589 RepID=V5TQY3_HALHI|nr:glycosyl transferase [Haloarcula hispanica]AEM57717.1 putative glycosyltransferase [Haloarcula hispanica ATCC 33960]AHB67513.1 hypothetical protein HISP_10830 [Haloarcula hispanica N601]